MKDSMKCQHALPEDVTYKEVVVIGNGPSGMVTSFMLAGNVPYLKTPPENLPIDEMLRARLSNLPEGQSLYDVDLMELAEGLEGRSQNPIPLLMDHLLRPCADLGIQADSLIEWRHEADKQIDHVVLGRGPAGGAWHSFPAAVRTLSPAAWLALPPLAPPAPPAHTARLPARAVALYCRRYVHACKLQRYFRCNVVVTSVTLAPEGAGGGGGGDGCGAPNCALAAKFCVTGYDKSSGRQFRYVCRRAVLAGGADRPRTLAPHLAPHADHSLAGLERAAHALAARASSPAATVLIVGSGVSAADAVWITLKKGLRVVHLHRTPAETLARLSPEVYPDYCQVYKMMMDGPSANHHNYSSYPSHVILDVTLEPSHLNTDDIEDYNIGLKRVKLLNIETNDTTEILVNVIAVFIGSKPDLSFLQTNFSLNRIDVTTDCQNCIDEKAKRKMEEKCFLKNHWLYLKSVLGQSIQNCKSRYLSMNGKCICDDKCDMKVIPYTETKDFNCQCEPVNLYSDGIGFGVDPNKPVDSKNPLAIDKSTHEMLNTPKGMYALGPLTGDNFMRFIPGGALAIVAHIHKDK